MRRRGAAAGLAAIFPVIHRLRAACRNRRALTLSALGPTHPGYFRPPARIIGAALRGSFASRKLSDEEIDASIKGDPDWSEDWNWGEAVLVIPPKKKAISIRVDEDVLDYFKQEGAGYQRRMNAVLRSYMEQKRKKRA